MSSLTRQEKQRYFGILSLWGGGILFPPPKMGPESPEKVSENDKKIFVGSLEPFELIHVIFFSKCKLLHMRGKNFSVELSH